jgi:hypothetical protein
VDVLRVPAKVHSEKGHAMALDQSALLELLEALKDADVDDRIRTATETLYQALIEAELTAVIGAAPHQRTENRTAQRNGSRPRTLTTTAGDLELRIPKLRAGSFFPSLLERRRRIDQALFAVVMEAYLHSADHHGERLREPSVQRRHRCRCPVLGRSASGVLRRLGTEALGPVATLSSHFGQCANRPPKSGHPIRGGDRTAS